MLQRVALLSFLLILATTSAGAQTPVQGMDFGRYHALIIGNNDYRNLPKLKTAIADAQGVADVFGQRYGFAVELLLNADRDQIVRAIAQYRTLKDGDNLVVYYAGHGVLDEASDRGFWLPVDAEKDNEARWIDIAVISGNLRAMNARHVLVIADSCYSGALTRDAATALPQSADRAVWLKRMRDRRARVALVSGGLEPVMDGGGSGHSVFARALINTLRENRGVLQGSELFDQLRGRVVVNSPQTPAYADIRMAGHEGGDFLFVAKVNGVPASLTRAGAFDGFAANFPSAPQMTVSQLPNGGSFTKYEALEGYVTYAVLVSRIQQGLKDIASFYARTEKAIVSDGRLIQSRSTTVGIRPANIIIYETTRGLRIHLLQVVDEKNYYQVLVSSEIRTAVDTAASDFLRSFTLE